MSRRLRNKPPFADWLVSQRTRHGWKAEDVARRLRDLGYEAEDSTYRTWESNSNRKPARDTIEALERLFDAAAPDEDGAAGAADIAAAIRAQTEVLEKYLGLLADHVSLKARVEEMDKTLQRLVATGPLAAGSEAPAKLPARRRSAG